jgi:glutaredoxin
MCEGELRSLLAAGKTFVVGMSHCPYTHRAVSGLGAGTPRFMLDEYDDSSRVLDWLRDEFDHQTVPMIFVDGRFKGGSEFMSSPEALALSARGRL